MNALANLRAAADDHDAAGWSLPYPRVRARPPPRNSWRRRGGAVDESISCCWRMLLMSVSQIAVNGDRLCDHRCAAVSSTATLTPLMTPCHVCPAPQTPAARGSPASSGIFCPGQGDGFDFVGAGLRKCMDARSAVTSVSV